MEKYNEEEKLNSSLRLLAKTSAVVLMGVIVSKIIGYVYRIIIARYYGPEVYGLFSLALMISGWFIAVASLGTTEGLLRYASIYRGKKEYEKLKYLFKFSLFISAIISVVSGILLFFMADYIALNIFHNIELSIYLKIFSIVVPL
ncbi:MAG: oligosaccharide flippase family protein, partial [Candidatus Pacebacteria bacterium]|nr:oligosaccharide flippase family protein [Candidatus Paceibacterota bacterium]